MFSNKKSSEKLPGGIRELLSIALPMIISTSCDGIMTFTDRLFLARIDPEQMNAVMGGGLALQTMSFFFMGIIGYSTALCARYYGAGQRNRSSLAAFQAFLLVLVSWPLIMAMEPAAERIFFWTGLSDGQIEYQCRYLKVLAAGSVFGMLRYSLGCFFSGIGRTRVVMTATAAAMAANVVLDYGLIFGNFGFPAMGVTGAALTTSAGSLAAVIILLIFYFAEQNRTKFSVMSSFRFDRKIMWNLIRYGYPAGIEFLLTFISSSIMTGLFHGCGPAAATASTVMFNWDLVSFIPLLGIEVSVTSLVGRYMGAENPDSAYRSSVSGIKAGLVYSSVIFVLFVFFPGMLTDVFRPDEASQIFEEARPLAMSMIRIASLYVLVQAVMIAMIGALRGAGDTLFPMLCTTASNAVGLPVLYVVLSVLRLPVTAGWTVMVSSFFIFFTFIIIRFKRGKWKNIRIE